MPLVAGARLGSYEIVSLLGAGGMGEVYLAHDAKLDRNGAPIPLFQPRAAGGGLGVGWFYDVAPDGRFLINMPVERKSPPATIVLNWRAGIAPRQP